MTEELDNYSQNGELETPQTVENETLNEPVTETITEEVCENKTQEPQAIENEQQTIEEPKVEEPKVESSEEKIEEQPSVNEEVTTQTETKTEVHVAPVTVEPTTVQTTIVPNTDDFDWNALEERKQSYSDTQRKELETIYDQTFNAIVEQQVINGTIVSLNDREVVVHIGFKSDGILPASELRYLPDLQVGDTIEVFVECREDAMGQLILSHKKACWLKSWERVNEAFEAQEIVHGSVKSKTKGGLIVDVFGVEAFLPGSQIDVKPIRDYDIFVDKTMEFKIVKINQEFKNVVVSHKALIESELEAQRLEIMAGLEKGQVLEGIVKNITEYGAFIDLGGVDGLVHITDLSWGRVAHPKEVLELDQKINVVILDFDEEKKRIALGIKQLTPHPWDALDPSLTVGDKVSGKVVVIADYGAFMEVLPGVEGLIHVSEMSWSQHLRTARDFLKEGETIEAVILTLDRDERKMSLGIKQLTPDPWLSIIERYPINSKHTGIVRNFTAFGIFIEIEEGVDGLIHVSDLTWKRVKHPAEFTKIGEKIDVVVLGVDSENRRLSVGHKQLEENPWDLYASVYYEGSIHKGTVLNSYNEKGTHISLQGIDGFCFSRGLQREDGTFIRPGETADFKVIEFSKEFRKILLSHSRIWQDERDAERDAKSDDERAKERTAARAASKLSESLEKSTFGDLDALSNLKADLELAEGKKKQKAKKTKEKPKEETVENEKQTVENEVVTEEIATTPIVENTNEEEVATETKTTKSTTKSTAKKTTKKTAKKSETTEEEAAPVSVTEETPVTEDITTPAETENSVTVEDPSTEPEVVHKKLGRPKKSTAKKAEEETPSDLFGTPEKAEE
jgi:small subunit ribosomal protein S1